MIDNYKEFTKHYIAVDCVIFSYEDDELKVLIYPKNFAPSIGHWSLMGGFVNEKESLEDTAHRILKETVGIEDIYIEQVGGFSEPGRDTGGRVISLGFFALTPIDLQDKSLIRSKGAHWWPIDELPKLLFDHEQIVEAALFRLQRKASMDIIGKDLLPKTFTLTMLHNLYNAIFRKKFDAGNFRKKILSLNILEKLPKKDLSSSKRGAYYYKFKDVIDTGSHTKIIKF